MCGCLHGAQHKCSLALSNSNLLRHGLLCCLAESEFALLLEAIAAGGSYQQLKEALQLMSHELNHLKPRTLALVQRFFE